MKLTISRNKFGLASIIYLGLFLFLFLRSYSPGRSGDNFAEVSAVLLVGLIASVGVLFALSFSTFRNKHLIFLFFLSCAFGTAMFSSIFGFYTAAVQGVINNFSQQFLFYILMVLVVCYRPWRDINFVYVLAHILMFFGVFTAIVGWQVLLTGKGLFGPLAFNIEALSHWRLTGFHASSSYSGIILALGLISAAYLNFVRKNGQKRIILLIFFLGLSLVATGSRGSMLVGASGFLVFFIFHKGRIINLFLLIKSRWFYISILLSLLLFGFYFLLPEDHLIRLSIDSSVRRVVTRTAKAGGLEGEARVIFLKQGIEFLRQRITFS